MDFELLFAPGIFHKLVFNTQTIKRVNTKLGSLFNTIGLCAANIDSTDLAMPNFYWYEQFG